MPLRRGSKRITRTKFEVIVFRPVSISGLLGLRDGFGTFCKPRKSFCRPSSKLWQRTLKMCIISSSSPEGMASHEVEIPL